MCMSHHISINIHQGQTGPEPELDFTNQQCLCRLYSLGNQWLIRCNLVLVVEQIEKFPGEVGWRTLHEPATKKNECKSVNNEIDDNDITVSHSVLFYSILFYSTCQL